MTDFKFKDEFMQKYVDNSKAAMADIFNIPVEEIECKGFRVFFLHPKTELTSSSGLFHDGYNPDGEGGEEEDTVEE